MQAFSDVTHGCLPRGTVTEHGVIEAMSATAYLIAGDWYHFTKIHGPYKTATVEWETMRFKLAEVQA